MSEIIIVEYNVFVCCDECCEITGTYLETCPFCGVKNVDVANGSIYEGYADEPFSCHNCGSEFQFIEPDYDINDPGMFMKVKVLKKSEKISK